VLFRISVTDVRAGAPQNQGRSPDERFLLVIRSCASIAIAALMAFSGVAAAQSATQQPAAPQQTAAAPTLTIEGYYEGVQDIFRSTAVKLGSAVGAEARAPLINVQNHCSRSLGKLRAMLRQAQSAPDAATNRRLAQSALAPYSRCKTAFDSVNG